MSSASRQDIQLGTIPTSIYIIFVRMRKKNKACAPAHGRPITSTFDLAYSCMVSSLQILLLPSRYNFNIQVAAGGVRVSRAQGWAPVAQLEVNVYVLSVLSGTYDPLSL